MNTAINHPHPMDVSRTTYQTIRKPSREHCLTHSGARMTNFKTRQRQNYHHHEPVSYFVILIKQAPAPLPNRLLFIVLTHIAHFQTPFSQTALMKD